MATSRKFVYVRAGLRRQWFGPPWLMPIVVAMIGLPLWLAGVFAWEFARWCVVGVAVLIGLKYWRERRLEARYWREYERMRLWFDDGSLYFATDAEQSSESLAKVVSVHAYTRRGRLVRVVVNHPDGSIQLFFGLDDMDAFLAEFRVHAPQAKQERMGNQWL